MAKKLKITEGQLKKLMERKHSYTDNTPEGEVEGMESNGPESAIINLDKEKEVGESKFGMGDNESIDEIADDLTRCHNDLSDLSSTMEQLTYAIDGNSKLADVAEQFDAAYVKITETLDDVSNVLSLVQEIAEREGEGDDEEEYDDEEGSEEDETMNESIKAIKANFKRFL